MLFSLIMVNLEEIITKYIYSIDVHLSTPAIMFLPSIIKSLSVNHISLLSHLTLLIEINPKLLWNQNTGELCKMFVPRTFSLMESSAKYLCGSCTGKCIIIYISGCKCFGINELTEQLTVDLYNFHGGYNFVSMLSRYSLDGLVWVWPLLVIHACNFNMPLYENNKLNNA